jgi:hypothetical protein
MASVEVFVDDAVRGRLPNVCAKTGAPADGRLRVQQVTGGFAGWWVFLLVPGMWWVAILLAAFGGRRRVLTVRLPYSREAVAYEQRLARRRAGAGAAFLVLFVSIVVSSLLPLPRLALVVATVIAGIVALVSHVTLVWTQVHVRLDASNRWVTLSGVHPWFATAVNAQVDERSDRL